MFTDQMFDEYWDSETEKSAIYVTRIRKWKQESLVAMRFVLLLIKLSGLSPVSVGQEASYKTLINYLFLHLSFAAIGATQMLGHLIGDHKKWRLCKPIKCPKLCVAPIEAKLKCKI